MTENDINNNIISILIEKHFNLTEESIKIFKRNLFNTDNERIIDPKIKNLLGDDLRLYLDISEETYSDIDNGWFLFKDYFDDMLANSDIEYKNFLENKIYGKSGEQKLFKATKKFYLDNPEALEKFMEKRAEKVKDKYDEVFEKRFQKMTEEIGKYKIPNRKLQLVISMNFADWFLSATSEKWTSCLNLESNNEGAFWSGFPGLITDPNKLLFYITDGSKKEYLGIKVDTMITRSWGIITEDDSVFPVRSYPTGLINSKFLAKLLPDFNFRDSVADKHEWIEEDDNDDWITKYSIELLFNKEGESSYIYQDYSIFCELGDSTAKLKRNESGMHTIIDNKITSDSAYHFTLGMKKLVEREETLGNYISGLIICSECQCSITEDNECYDEDGKVLCQNCFDEQYTFCQKCGEMIKVLDSNLLEHEILCGSCYHDKTYHCYECDEIMEDINEVHSSPSGDVLCERCFFEDYGTCYDCGEVFELNELNPDHICPICSPAKETSE